MQASFVDLVSDRDALVNMLTRLNLIEAGELPAVHRLTGGVSSNIVRVDTRAGSFCLKQALPTLKVEKEWHAPVERVFEEVAWLRAARAIVPRHIPAVLHVDAASGSFLMEYLPGDRYTRWKDSLLAGDVVSGVARQLGGVLNRIHNQTAGDPAIMASFDKAFNDENFMLLRLDAYLLEAGRQHPERAAQLGELLHSFLHNRRALVHGDISPKNILIGPYGPVILDAECACYGDPAFDAAFLLSHLLLKAVYRPEKATAYSHEFDGFVDAYFADITWEEKAHLEQRVALLLPALLLARIDGKSPVEYLNAQQRATVRRLTFPLLDAQSGSLAHIQSMWYPEINQ